jgi:hypothetical protein
MNNITVTMGDWSSDGHGKTESVVISTNLTSEEIEAGYKAGTKIIGKSFIDKYCENYEDSSMSFHAAEPFEKAGIKFDKVDRTDNRPIAIYSP